ncbi:MAG: hypothetical protein ACI9S8_002625 [Chlamydiales bacterium]|jgi:hypothetical protein
MNVDEQFPILCLAFFVAAIIHSLLSDRFLILAHRYDIDGDEKRMGKNFAASFFIS